MEGSKKFGKQQIVNSTQNNDRNDGWGERNVLKGMVSDRLRESKELTTIREVNENTSQVEEIFSTYTGKGREKLLLALGGHPNENISIDNILNDAKDLPKEEQKLLKEFVHQYNELLEEKVSKANKIKEQERVKIQTHHRKSSSEAEIAELEQDFRSLISSEHFSHTFYHEVAKGRLLPSEKDGHELTDRERISKEAWDINNQLKALNNRRELYSVGMEQLTSNTIRAFEMKRETLLDTYIREEETLISEIQFEYENLQINRKLEALALNAKEKNS